MLLVSSLICFMIIFIYCEVWHFQSLSILQMHAGRDQLDATSSHMPVPDFTQGLESVERFASRPLQGRRIGIIRETVGEGLSAGVSAAFDRAARHLEALGAEVHEVKRPLRSDIIGEPNSLHGLQSYQHMKSGSILSMDLNRYAHIMSWSCSTWAQTVRGCLRRFLCRPQERVCQLTMLSPCQRPPQICLDMMASDTACGRRCVLDDSALPLPENLYDGMTL